LENTKASIVPVVLEQGIPAIAAILGVLKAGRTYLHLDPVVLPSPVIERVLDRLQASTTVSDKETQSTPALSRPWIDIAEIEAGRTDEPDVEMSSDDVAQLLLTSGSTGDPKIICHTHRTLLTSVRSSTNYYHICPEDRLTLFASASGQASHLIFSSLLNGASAHHLNVRKESFLQVAERILNDAITIYFSSVTLFRHFLNAVGADQIFPDVRLVRLASEPAYKKDFELWKRHFTAECILMNGLAASEAGVALEYYVGRQAGPDSVYLPIGRHVEGLKFAVP
jgi:acyl-coenzyme A synthetase/AMP-(fatty) acid ligase